MNTVAGRRLPLLLPPLLAASRLWPGMGCPVGLLRLCEAPCWGCPAPALAVWHPPAVWARSRLLGAAFLMLVVGTQLPHPHLHCLAGATASPPAPVGQCRNHGRQTEPRLLHGWQLLQCCLVMTGLLLGGGSQAEHAQKQAGCLAAGHAGDG